MGVEGLVAAVDQPAEHARVDRLGQRADGPVHLVQVLALVHPLGADLDARPHQRPHKLVPHSLRIACTRSLRLEILLSFQQSAPLRYFL